jgi:hypothetical protein
MSTTVTTTNKEVFSVDESAELARLVFKRFGRDSDVAAAAWRRMLGNNCTVSQYLKLVDHAYRDSPPALHGR